MFEYNQFVKKKVNCRSEFHKGKRV